MVALPSNMELDRRSLEEIDLPGSLPHVSERAGGMFLGWSILRGHFGVGAPPIFHFSGDWDVHWEYGVLTHSHMGDLWWTLLGICEEGAVLMGVSTLAQEKKEAPGPLSQRC